MENAQDAVIAAMLLEQAPDAIIFADRDGIVRHWNAAAATLFGFAPEDALGKDLNLVIPGQFREAHWAGYDRALAAGETKYRGQSLPTHALKATGETFYVELSFAIVHDAEGAVVGALAHARDITGRFEQERENRRRLRELEETVKTLGARDLPRA